MNRLILAAWLTVLGLAADVAHRYRGWRTLIIASWNIGPARQVPDRLREGDVDVLALQESGDQWGPGGMLAKLRAAGFRFITGARAGQASTPLAWSPTALRLVKVKRYLLAESQDGGPGAGPDRVKQKWAIGGLFEILDTGRHAWFFSDHFVASQQHRKRRNIAVGMVNRILLLGHRLRRPTFWLQDANAKPDSPVLEPIRRSGWSVSQLLGRLLGTHGRRAIDMGWWTPRRWIHFLRHSAIATTSDHDLVVIELAINPRRNHQKEHR